MTTASTEFNQSVMVPLSETAHQFARAFAAEQLHLQQGKRVYLNTLAVYAVRTYLGWARIPCDLDGSHSWHPLLQGISDRVDLLLPDIGRVECCPILPGATSFEVPMLSEDSVAYVGVKFDTVLTQVELLGYHPIVGLDEVPDSVEIEHLFPIDQFTDYLFRVQDGLEFIEHHSDDPDVQKLQQLLDEEERSPVEVIVRLEQLRNEEWRWEFEGINAIKQPDYSSKTLVAKLQNLSSTTDLSEENAEAEIKQLANNLLHKLKQLWDEAE